MHIKLHEVYVRVTVSACVLNTLLTMYALASALWLITLVAGANALIFLTIALYAAMVEREITAYKIQKGEATPQ